MQKKKETESESESSVSEFEFNFSVAVAIVIDFVYALSCIVRVHVRSYIQHYSFKYYAIDTSHYVITKLLLLVLVYNVLLLDSVLPAERRWN